MLSLSKCLLSDFENCAGGYFSTAGADPNILLQMKEDYDGAEPAASSIAISNLLRLAASARPESASRRASIACPPHALRPLFTRQYTTALETVPVQLSWGSCGLQMSMYIQV